MKAPAVMQNYSSSSSGILVFGNTPSQSELLENIAYLFERSASYQ